MIVRAIPRLRQVMTAAVFAVPLAVGSTAFGYSAVATADPCTNTSVRDADQCCAESNGVRAPGSVCVDTTSDGILGDLPVVGNLPGLGGVL